MAPLSAHSQAKEGSFQKGTWCAPLKREWLLFLFYELAGETLQEYVHFTNLLIIEF